MIIWINGPYGVGKSTLAETLHRQNPNRFIFDAEAVGNAVRDNLPPERQKSFENVVRIKSYGANVEKLAASVQAAIC